jgi:hypothetical protein
MNICSSLRAALQPSRRPALDRPALPRGDGAETIEYIEEYPFVISV